MRVLGINNITAYKTILNPDNPCNKIREYQVVNNNYIYNNCCSVAFTSLVTSASSFKEITKCHDIRCPYCDCYMLNEGTLNKLLKSGKFNGTLVQFLETAKSYKKYLKPWRRRFLKTLERYAKKNPQKTLSDAIKDMYPDSQKRLVRKQAKVLKKLDKISKNILDNEKKSKFDEFMHIQYNRLYEIPYVENFRSKVFIYKLGKILKTSSDSNNVKELLLMSRLLSASIFKDLSNRVPDLIIRSITKGAPLPDKTVRSVVTFAVEKMKYIAKQEKLSEVVQLCETAEKMLNSRPVVISFSNKEFVYDLRTYLLPGWSQTTIGKRILDIAKALPSSGGNKDSFIVKHKNSSSNTIAYKFFEPSTATIEHIQPRSLNGVNRLDNMALACRADNNNRGNLSLAKFLGWKNRRKPQHYFNDLIKLNNIKKFLEPATIQDMARHFENEGSKKIRLWKMRKDN